MGFTGFVAHSAAAMRTLDVVVHASTEPEPFGLVIAEAMATGRPVIISYSGGAEELRVLGLEVIASRPHRKRGLVLLRGRGAAASR